MAKALCLSLAKKIYSKTLSKLALWSSRWPVLFQETILILQSPCHSHVKAPRRANGSPTTFPTQLVQETKSWQMKLSTETPLWEIVKLNCLQKPQKGSTPPHPCYNCLVQEPQINDSKCQNLRTRIRPWVVMQSPSQRTVHLRKRPPGWALLRSSSIWSNRLSQFPSWYHK